MKRFLVLLLGLVMLLAVTGCAQTPGTADTSATGQSGTAAVVDRPVTELSYLGGGAYIYEHYFDTNGTLIRTDVRSSQWAYGMILGQLRYVYDESGILTRIEEYLNEGERDNDSVEEVYTGTMTLYRVAELTGREGNTLKGQLYSIQYGTQKSVTEYEVSLTYEDGRVTAASWEGVQIEFDENGRKTAETLGDQRVSFSYDAQGLPAGMTVREGDALKYTFTASFTAEGYIAAFARKDEEKGETHAITYDIDGETGKNRRFLLEETGENGTKTTEVALTYNQWGHIAGVDATVSDRERFVIQNTYNERGQLSTSDYLNYYDGQLSSKETLTYTFGENGKKSQCVTQYYYDADEDGEMELRSDELATYLYDDKGRLVEKRNGERMEANSSTNIYTYTYDDSGFRVKEVYGYTYQGDPVQDRTVEYTYHENGIQKQQTKTETFYNEEGAGSTTKTVFDYNEKGDEIKRTIYDVEDGEQVLRETWLITHTYEFISGTKVKRVTETIIYDAQGEPTKKRITTTTYSPNGSASSSGMEYTYENGEWV